MNAQYKLDAPASGPHVRHLVLIHSLARRACIAGLWIALMCANLCFAQRVTNPREMLDIMQVDASQRKHFLDDRSIEDELETLGRVLFRLPRFAQVDVDRWAKPIDDVTEMQSNTDSYRFQMFDLHGELTDFRVHQVIPENVPRLGFREYFSVQIRHDNTQSIIYTRTIPQKWLQAIEQKPVGETVRAQALLLKRNVNREGDENGEAQLIFAASRLNWHPSKPSRLFATTQDQVLLAQLGMDIDRLSDLVQRSKMTANDRECFYQALAAVQHAEPEQLAKLGKQEFDIAKMIQHPEAVGGELYTLHGMARRAIMIRVEDPDIRERFGIDHYYEVEVFIPMERQVRFIDPNEPEDKEGKVFTDYPFVICVPELPPGMEQGDDIRIPATFSGFFLKLWAYETAFMSDGRARTAKPRLQQSPLFIGPTLTVGERYVPRESQVSLYIACLFVGLLLCIWLLMWRSSVQDKRASKQLFRKHDAELGAFDWANEHSD